MIAVVSPDLQRLAAGSRLFPKELQVATRKELRTVATSAAAETRSKIRSMPAAGGVPYKRPGGLRASIASAVRISAGVSSSKGASITIRVAKTGALGDRYRVAQKLDGRGGSFRHPLFGNREHWYPQATYPWFYTTIVKHAPQMRAAAETALRFATLASIPNVR